MLKKTIISCAVGALCASTSVMANEAPPYEGWIGGFAQYYQADNDKPEPNGFLDEGNGYGVELGFRFDKNWAVRFELADQDIDADDSKAFGMDLSGKSYGADALYFLEDDVAYLFAGLRHQNLDENYRMAAAGVGKHWTLNENWRVITEAGAFRDFGEGFNDYSVKLGIAYVFGAAPASTPEKDTDGDGVIDSRDQCPMTPAGQAVDATGCNNDLDGDGVVNSLDQCPNTPRGTAVDAKGCPLVKDSDNDGVPDDKDQCPDSRPNDKVDETGCVIFAEKELSISLNVLFANDSAAVNNPTADDIREFAEFLNRYVNTSAVIEGHTSAVGPAAYNLSLSERRAEAVKTLLVEEYGIDASRLSAVGFGETRLLNDANTAEAHRLNRRIEATVSATVKEPVTQ